MAVLEDEQTKKKKLLSVRVEHLKGLFPGVSVKPDPPESLLVRQVEGFSARLMVSWSFPSSWPLDPAFPLLFHIRYRPLGSMFWSEVSGLAGGEGPHGRFSSLLWVPAESSTFCPALVLLHGESRGGVGRSGRTLSPSPGPGSR